MYDVLNIIQYLTFAVLRVTVWIGKANGIGFPSTELGHREGQWRLKSLWISVYQRIQNYIIQFGKRVTS
jgi:hypothetical protein